VSARALKGRLKLQKRLLQVEAHRQKLGDKQSEMKQLAQKVKLIPNSDSLKFPDADYFSGGIGEWTWANSALRLARTHHALR